MNQFRNLIEQSLFESSSKFSSDEFTTHHNDMLKHGFTHIGKFNTGNHYSKIEHINPNGYDVVHSHHVVVGHDGSVTHHISDINSTLGKHRSITYSSDINHHDSMKGYSLKGATVHTYKKTGGMG